MTLVCQAPDCGHEFHPSVLNDIVEANQVGETPLLTHIHEAEDGFGVVTDYLCSAECMAAYLVAKDGELDDVEKYITDGGQVAQEWVVRDTERGNEKRFDSRDEAERALDELESLGFEGELQLAEPEGAEAGSADDFETEHEVVEHGFESGQAVTDGHDTAPDLPDRTVAEDPLNWVPGEFVDEIDGTLAINRKGFEVLSHFYDISVFAKIQVPPEDTGFKFCRVKATAVTPDGRECEAFGSAHVKRGDDAELLLEMADTRARKRALSVATGVGAVAVAELKSSSELAGGERQ